MVELVVLVVMVARAWGRLQIESTTSNLIRERYITTSSTATASQENCSTSTSTSQSGSVQSKQTMERCSLLVALKIHRKVQTMPMSCVTMCLLSCQICSIPEKVTVWPQLGRITYMLLAPDFTILRRLVKCTRLLAISGKNNPSSTETATSQLQSPSKIGTSMCWAAMSHQLQISRDLIRTPAKINHTGS